MRNLGGAIGIALVNTWLGDGDIAVRDSVVCEAVAGEAAEGSLYLVSNRRPQEFRVVLARGGVDESGRFALDAAQLDALEIAAGDSVRIAPLQPTR